jgi:hypothetical protein
MSLYFIAFVLFTGAALAAPHIYRLLRPRDPDQT